MIIFRNAAILDPVLGRLLSPRDVVVDGSDIVQVSETPLTADAAQVIDLQGRGIHLAPVDAK